MRLGTRRRVLSVFLFIIIAAATAILITSAAVNQTLASPQYIKKHVVTSQLVSECEKQLNIKFEGLESESGIPVRVFQTIKNDYSVTDALKYELERPFSEEESTLYGDNLVDAFYDLCTEYCEGSGIEYNGDNLNRTAVRAAEIYREVVAIHGTDIVAARSASLGKTAKGGIMVSILLLVICSALLIYLYTVELKAVAYITGGISSGAGAVSIGSLLLILTNAYTNLSLSPLVYQSVMSDYLKSFLVLLAALGALAAVIAYSVMIISLRSTMKRSKD